MEPLDPKAELMRLADEFAGRVEARVDNNKARAALESAITIALAAERRRALTEAADLCDRWAESDWHGALLANQIRAIIEKKD